MNRIGKISVHAWPLLLTAFGLCLSLPTHAGSRATRNDLAAQQTEAKTTYEKFLPEAQAGDPDIQYLLGFMFLHGEGIPIDYDQAHRWFHRSADQGNKIAQRLLGTFHSRALPRIPAAYYAIAEANFWFNNMIIDTPLVDSLSKTTQEYQQLRILSRDKRGPGNKQWNGKSVFVNYCAPCHGLDGNAAYPAAPSFAKGERLYKSDTELLNSIIHGKGVMPAWGEALSAQLAADALAYIRQRFEAPLSQPSRIEAAANNPQQQLSATLAEGERVFMTFCSGCHGFNGIAYYVHSPSFALRERLHKSDKELMRSIAGGKGEMPGWGNKISDEKLHALIIFIRSLAPAYEAGIIGETRKPEGIFFLFKTLGEKGSKWGVPNQPSELNPCTENQ